MYVNTVAFLKVTFALCSYTMNVTCLAGIDIVNHNYNGGLVSVVKKITGA